MVAKRTAKPTNSRNRPTGERGRKNVDSTEIPVGVRSLLDEMMENIKDCVPISICCNLIGLDVKVWRGYCDRYPALTLEIQKQRAPKIVELQRKAAGGEQGWQAAFRALESLDSENWNRNAQASSVVKEKKSPLQRAIKARQK